MADTKSFWQEFREGELGNTDISGIGDGTITGALKALSDGGGGSGGTSNYNSLSNRPTYYGTTIAGETNTILPTSLSATEIYDIINN